MFNLKIRKGEPSSIFLLVIALLIIWCSSSGDCYSGSREEEISICSHSLNALLHGDTEAEEQSDSHELTSVLPSDNQKAEVIRRLNSMVALMQAVGGGLPSQIGRFEDVLLDNGKAAGVISQLIFPNGHLAFAGCVRFFVIDGYWTTAIRFDESRENLIEELNHPENVHTIGVE